jgi:predicted DNA-binding protein
MTKQTAFRIPEETLAHLDEMVQILGTNRTAFLCLKIEQEYEAMQGNPKMKRMLEALKECAAIMRNAGIIVDDPCQIALDTVGALALDESR